MWTSPKDRYRFKRLGETHLDRAGDDPDSFNLVGRVIIHFNFLEEQISLAIIKLLKVDTKVGHILTAELSFKNKVNLLGSLYLELKDHTQFNSFFKDQDEAFNEILIACNECEELRNKIAHSQFDYLHDANKNFVRRKMNSKAKNGLIETREIIDPDLFLDISDHMCELGHDIEEFFYSAVDG